MQERELQRRASSANALRQRAERDNASLQPSSALSQAAAATAAGVTRSESIASPQAPATAAQSLSPPSYDDAASQPLRQESANLIDLNAEETTTPSQAESGESGVQSMFAGLSLGEDSSSANNAQHDNFSAGNNPFSTGFDNPGASTLAAAPAPAPAPTTATATATVTATAAPVMTETSSSNLNPFSALDPLKGEGQSAPSTTNPFEKLREKQESLWPKGE